MEKKEIFDYIRFGLKGYQFYNPLNNRTIVRKSDYTDTLFPRCGCFIGDKWIEDRAGIEAVDWVFGD